MLDAQWARMTAAERAQVRAALGKPLSPEIDNAASQWEQQLDSLRDMAERWTGNSLQVVDLSFHERRHPAKARLALLEEIQRDGIELHRIGAMSIWSAGTDLPSLTALTYSCVCI